MIEWKSFLLHMNEQRLYQQASLLLTSNHLFFQSKKYKKIERKQTTVLEVNKAYQVRANNVYKWIDKYSLQDKKGLSLVVEMESETKRVLALLQKKSS